MKTMYKKTKKIRVPTLWENSWKSLLSWPLHLVWHPEEVAGPDCYQKENNLTESCPLKKQSRGCKDALASPFKMAFNPIRVHLWEPLGVFLFSSFCLFLLSLPSDSWSWLSHCQRLVLARRTKSSASEHHAWFLPLSWEKASRLSLTSSEGSRVQWLEQTLWSWSESLIFHLLPVRSWESYLTFPCLHFFLCEVEMTIVPTCSGHYEG